MKKAIIATILLVVSMHSNIAQAVSTNCYTGPFGGLQKTAYVKIRTDFESGVGVRL